MDGGKGRERERGVDGGKEAWSYNMYRANLV